MKFRSVRSWLAGVTAVLVAGCWTAPRSLITGGKDPGAWIDGLSSCRPEDSRVVRLDPTRPLTLLVHGCNFSSGGFRTLAQVFEAHGQQTLCFNYNDRARLDHSADQLVTALEALEKRLPGQEITIMGHSQGGLVARHALVADRERPVRVPDNFRIKLVTVSSPFAGISSSKHCGLLWLHLLTLGITVGVCQGIAGSKWHEIFPGSEFMENPGTLGAPVTDHLKIVTDERGVKDDFIFALDEQYNPAVDRDRRVAGVEVKAGHVEIVGERGTPPTKLIAILQAQNILVQTPPERRAEIASLLQRLY